ncbi:MAG: hypothetical protein AAF830_16765 [Pseudomonadota bacterium]
MSEETKDRPARKRSGMLQRTYTGLLDDSMLRHDADFVGERFFNKMILKNLLFGGGIYLNDGYLVNHPVARRHLYNERSILRVMLSQNFIRLLTRTGAPEDLADMPLRMAEAGNASFAQLVSSPEWADFQPLLGRIADAAFFNGNPRPWPNYDMSVGYRKLIEPIFGYEPARLGLRLVTWDELQQIRKEYLALKPEEGNGRHKLETSAETVLNETARDPRASLQELMAIGNQAYHYNFGLALTADEDDGIAVDTTVGAAFDELLQTRAVERGQIEGIPLIQLPENLPMDEGTLFWPFTDPSSEVSVAKRQYLEALDRLLAENAGGIDDLRRDVRDATDLYLDRISTIFATESAALSFDIKLEAGVTFAAGRLTSGVADRDAVATAAPTAGLALKIQASASSQAREVLVDRFRITDATAEYNPSHEDLITLGDIKPQITSLAFDRAKAEAFIATIPPMFER